MSGSLASLHAAVSFAKLPGTLTADGGGTLRWTPSSSSAAGSALNIDESTVMSLQVSSEASKQVVMVLQLAEGVKAGPEGKNRIFLHFNGSQAACTDERQRAIEDRNMFKTYLIDVVNKNKARTGGTPTTGETSSPAAGVTEAARVNTPTKVVASGTSTPTKPGAKATKSGPTELQIRINVLKANPTLAVLHQDVVMSKQISDQEFWSHPTRRALLNAERASMEQRQGRNARIADPRPTADESGEMRINLTPDLIRDTLAQNPVVARAYEENVPTVMDEASFWKRYYSSKLYHRLRTSSRSQASQHTIKPDDVFDKYLTEEDDGIEPRKQHNAHDAFLDLGATAEDHGETGNEKDWTMRAGVERKTLPLMRRFNDHSQSLLDSALGEQDAAMRRKKRAEAVGLATESDSDDGLVIDELQEEDAQKKRKLLDVRDRRSLFDERGGELAAASEKRRRSQVDVADLSDEQVARMLQDAIQTWSTSLEGAMDAKGKDSASAMKLMLSNVRSRQQSKSWRRANEMPEAMLKSLVQQNASSTEFLRQLWGAIAPQPLQDGRMPTNQSAAKRKAQAQRMLSTLRAAEERFNQLKADGDERVTSATAPISAAIQRALHLPLSGGSE